MKLIRILEDETKADNLFCWLFFSMLGNEMEPMCILSYIDPTATSALLYVLIGLGAAVFYSCREFFYRVVDAFSYARTRKTLVEKNDLVFYSEGKQYWNTFRPVLEALDEWNVPYYFISSDATDPGLSHKGTIGCRSRFVSPKLTPPFLNHLKANMVVMTTPQIGVLTIRRSKWVAHYAHLVHAPTDLFTYRKFAFDHFDSVLTAGPHQIKAARHLEALRGTPEKRLFETGCCYYDVLAKQPRTDAEKRPGNTTEAQTIILVAPTWKPYGFLNRFGKRLIGGLSKDPCFRVIFRPHPQSFISFPDVLEEIKNEFKDNERFEFDQNADGSDSMNRSHILVSELSGIVFDYAFLQRKPTLIFNGDPDLRGFEAEDFDYPMWEVAVRSQVGTEFGVDDIDSLGTKVKQTLQRFSPEDILSFRDRNIYNFGKAGTVAASQILEILETIRQKKEEL